MHHLMTGILSEKCVVRRFRICAKVIVYLQKLDIMDRYTPRLRVVSPIASRLKTCTVCYCTEFCRPL
jgi:hypothetical protein